MVCAGGISQWGIWSSRRIGGHTVDLNLSRPGHVYLPLLEPAGCRAREVVQAHVENRELRGWLA